jgi:hypothetical protein
VWILSWAKLDLLDLVGFKRKQYSKRPKKEKPSRWWATVELINTIIRPVVIINPLYDTFSRHGQIDLVTISYRFNRVQSIQYYLLSIPLMLTITKGLQETIKACLVAACS